MLACSVLLVGHAYRYRVAQPKHTPPRILSTLTLLCLPSPLTPSSRQSATLARRRREYADMVPEYYDVPHEERSEDELAAYRQVCWRKAGRGLPRGEAMGIMFTGHTAVWLWARGGSIQPKASSRR